MKTDTPLAKAARDTLVSAFADYVNRKLYAEDVKSLIELAADQVANLERKLNEAKKDRDDWVFNAKELQKGYNELDARLREANKRIAELEKALSRLLHSSDSEWLEGKMGGHDWKEAVAEATAAMNQKG